MKTVFRLLLVSVIMWLGYYGHAEDWSDRLMHQLKIIKVQDQAVRGQPPLDDSGHVTRAFKDRINKEWLPYRASEFCANQDHIPARDFIYGPTFASLNRDWRINFEAWCISSWDESIRRGVLTRKICQ